MADSEVEHRVEGSVLIDQAAELLGLSRRTVYYRIRQGRLRTITTRCHSQRVLLSSIGDLLREMRQRGSPSAEPAPAGESAHRSVA
jgi:excisionase family DNA binding protein